MSAQQAPSMKAPVTPCGRRLLVKMRPANNRTHSGLYKPDEAAAREQFGMLLGRVVAMGPLCYTDPYFDGVPYCGEGDWVLMSSYAGQRLHWQDQEYRVLADQDILGVTDIPVEIEA